MSEFSASDAAIDGFQVIRRNWRVMVGWAMFNMLAMIAMIAMSVILLVAVYSAIGEHGRSSELAAQVVAIVATLGAVAGQVVITVGLYRLMLRPQDPAFLFLRIGPDEIRVLGTVIVIAVVWIAEVALGAFAVAAASGLGTGLAIFVGLVLAIVAIAINLRFALAPVLTFVTGRIQIVQAWRMSKGRLWALFGMTLLTLCLTGAVAVVSWIVLFLLGGALSGFRDLGLSGAESLTAHPGRYIFQIAAEVSLTPLFLVISQAPWVAVYRALAEPVAD